MAALTEEQIINGIAKWERSIEGVRNSYDYARNPDSLTGQTPCVVHIPVSFASENRAHHNVWTNAIVMESVLFVSERMNKAGTLKYLENDALKFGYLWRHKFQTESVISDLFTSTSNTVRVFLRAGEYGAGGTTLSHNGIQYIGWVFRWEFKEN